MIYKCKCKLCDSVMSPKDGDYIICKCGEVTLDGLKKVVVCGKDVQNYIEIDDTGNPIVGKTEEVVESLSGKPCKADLLVMLDEMIAGIERLPQAALYAPCSNQDLASALLLLSAIFAADS